MNRLHKVVEEVKNADAFRSKSLLNASNMFEQARTELKTLTEIKFSIPELDQRDGQTRYVLKKEVYPSDPGYPSITHIVLRLELTDKIIAYCDEKRQMIVGNEPELFRVANHLMADV